TSGSRRAGAPCALPTWHSGPADIRKDGCAFDLPIAVGILAATEQNARLVKRTVRLDRKSTRLNSSHEWSSYAVFCLKKKTVRYPSRGSKAKSSLLSIAVSTLSTSLNACFN